MPRKRILKEKLRDYKQLIDNADDIMKQIVSKNIQTVTRQEEGKTISIDQLPECTFKELLTSIVQDTSQAKICVIAYLEKDDSWNAYAGYPDVRDLVPAMKIESITPYSKDEIGWRCENIRDCVAVLIMGEKLDKDTALLLFPDWSIRTYGE
jgi:hypothetical protein